MWIVVLLLIVAAVAAAGLWYTGSKKKQAQVNTTYVCPECGERHCNCFPEDRDR